MAGRTVSVAVAALRLVLRVLQPADGAAADRLHLLLLEGAEVPAVDADATVGIDAAAALQRVVLDRRAPVGADVASSPASI